MKSEIRVTLKEQITDAEGKNVKKALNMLGFDSVDEVRVAKVFVIKLNHKDKLTASKELNEMCEKLLANPVIHKYEISILEK